jgi:hypothetical protein
MVVHGKRYSTYGQRQLGKNTDASVTGIWAGKIAMVGKIAPTQTLELHLLGPELQGTIVQKKLQWCLDETVVSPIHGAKKSYLAVGVPRLKRT